MEQTLGKRIMAHRKNMGLTQDALAERLGVTAQAVSKWENDLSCPDITTLPKLAEVFGTTTDELLGVERQEEPIEVEVVTEDHPAGDQDGHTAKGGFEFKWNSGRKDALALSILVLLVGGLTLAARLMHWSAGFWDILWPSALMVYSGSLLLRKFTILRACCTLAGLYFLITNLNDWDFGFDKSLLFPVVLLVLGVSLMVNALRKPRRPQISLRFHNHKSSRTGSHQIDGERFDCSGTFCEEKYHIAMPRLSQGTALVSFGEMVVDLAGVEQVSGNCTVDLSCCFGEMTLLVPRRFRVKPANSTFLAGFTVSGEPDRDPAGTIHVDASASFGEICIRYI